MIKEWLVVTLAVLLAAVAIVYGCGAPTYVPYEGGAPSQGGTPAPKPSPGGGGGTSSVSWDQVKPLLQQNCAVSGCHSNPSFVQTEALFFSSAAPNRIANGSMPASNASPELKARWNAVRPQVLQYIEAHK